MFDSAEERTRRDLFAVYYWGSDAGPAVSVVIPRAGPADARGPVPQTLQEVLGRSKPPPVRYRQKTGIPVGPDHRKTIEAYFAGLPAGTSERTMLVKPVRQPEGFEASRPDRVWPTRVRILHVSASGEAKTLDYLKGDATLLPDDVPSGGAALAALDQLFLELAGK